MYKMLTSTNKVLTGLVRNSEFVMQMNARIIDGSIFRNFPIYCIRIINRYVPLEKQQRMVIKASESLSLLIPNGKLPEEIFTAIVQKLDPKDVTNLARFKDEQITRSYFSFQQDLLNKDALVIVEPK